MTDWTKRTGCTAFEGSRRIASGALADVARQTKAAVDRGRQTSILIFDDVTSELIEVDFRGTAEDVVRRLPEPPPESKACAADNTTPRGPGRPRLGVVARE